MSIINPGTTSYIEYVHLDRFDGKFETGKIYSDITAYYIRPGGNPVQITTVNGTITQAYTSGLFKEVNSTTMPGLYRFDIPDACFAVGADKVNIVLSGYHNDSSTQLSYDLGVVAQNEISTPPFKIISDQNGSDEKLDVVKNSNFVVGLKMVDANNAPQAIGGKTCSVKIYDGTNTLVATYTPTVRYDANGEITFTITSTVTGTVGTYNCYVERVGISETIKFGPMQIKVQNL